MEKENKKNIFSRRSFLKGLGLGTAAVAAPTIVSCAKGDKQVGEQEPPIGKMTYRTCPTSGDKVSILGYGMMRLPTKNDNIGERQNGEGEIDQEMVNKQVDYALEHGLNLFDTSPVYCKGLSEKAVGIALSRHDRKKYFISTKMSNMHEFAREASIAMFEKSLADLQTDYIDYYLWHNIGGSRDEEGLDSMGLFEARFIKNGMMDYLNKKKEYQNRLKVAMNVGEPEQYGFVLRKGNTKLLEKLNKGIRLVKENGAYDRVLKEYMGAAK